MAQFTAQDIQALRRQAGVGMMDAKKALQDAGGDAEKAYELLRERGLAAAAKRADRSASDGTIGSYLHVQSDHPVMGVLVELMCETDFVAKSADFNRVANDIAMHISWGNPRWVRREEVDPSVVDKETELIRRQAEAEGKPERAIPKIVEGRLAKWYADNVLYDQEFVNKERFEGTVGEMVTQLAATMGENIGVGRISRIAIGGGAE